MKPTLVVLAAGMGSRYGGMKQIDPVGQNGEIIMDYSIYDALQAGFGKVVFIINRKFRADFDEKVANRVAPFVDIEYVYQDLDALPEGFAVPEGREKPWGTAHALLCCADVVKEPFAVINADDYYGKDAFVKIAEFLGGCDDMKSTDFAMVGYEILNTLTENGSVARGVCETENGFLTDVVERTHIVKGENGPKFSEDGGETFTDLPADATVSMNFWGFTSAIFDAIRARFDGFFRETVPANPMKAEMYIPGVVGEMLQAKEGTVKVLTSGDKWHGVTYREDKPAVMQAMKELTESGAYPADLWAK